MDDNYTDSFDLLEEIILFEGRVTNITNDVRKSALQKKQLDITEYTHKLNDLLILHEKKLKQYSINPKNKAIFPDNKIAANFVQS
jgi:hypothetical protein